MAETNNNIPDSPESTKPAEKGPTTPMSPEKINKLSEEGAARELYHKLLDAMSRPDVKDKLGSTQITRLSPEVEKRIFDEYYDNTLLVRRENDDNSNKYEVWLMKKGGGEFPINPEALEKLGLVIPKILKDEADKYRQAMRDIPAGFGGSL